MNTASSQNGELLSHLQEITRSAHAALEDDLGLLDEILDLKGYQGILERFYGFWHDWEISNYNPRKRAHLLRADLSALTYRKRRSICFLAVRHCRFGIVLKRWARSMPLKARRWAGGFSTHFGFDWGDSERIL